MYVNKILDGPRGSAAAATNLYENKLCKFLWHNSNHTFPSWL